MERVKLSISGRELSLKSDDPQRLHAVAIELQKKIEKLKSVASAMSFTDIVLLVALNYADESYDIEKKLEDAEKQAAALKTEALRASDKAIQTQAEKDIIVAKYNELEEAVAGYETQLKELQDRLSSVNSVAEEKYIEEKEQYIKRISELEAKNAGLEATWTKLKSDYENSQSKRNDNQREEITQLKATVATYEKTFDEYAKQKNAEVKALNDELNTIKKKYADLSAQMNEIVSDGQMTL